MKRLILPLLMTLCAAPVAANDPADPLWPCIQRRQPALSVGAMWTGPAPDAATEARARAPEIAGLAEGLALRRLPLPEAEARIAAFAETALPADLTALFLAVFTRIDSHRSRVIEGIDRYAKGQTDLAARIEATRAEMARLEAATPPDFDAIDKLETQLDWDSRIFDERRASLSAVCENPVILEQRAFALGRAMAVHLP